MTAPNIAPTGLEGLDAFESTIAATLQESKDLIGSEQDIAHRPRNDKGQFITISGEDPHNQPKGAGEWNQVPDAAPGELAPVVEGQPAVEAPAEGEPPAPVIPDGHVALPPLAAEKVQGFKVMDADGEIIPPDLKFEVNFNNKTTGEKETRTLDLPQLVNYARMGRYNHEREQAFDQTQREVQQYRANLPQIEQAIRARDQRIDRLLSDPQFLAAELQRYDLENTPEARAQRERDNLQREREQFQLQQMARQSEEFIDTRLAPALDKIHERFPHVAKEELANKLLWAADPYRVNGVLDPRAYDTVATYIVRDLYPWAEQVHLDRSTSQPKPAKQETPKPDKPAPVQQQRAKRIGVAVMKSPAGQPQGTPAQPKAPHSNRGMEEFIVGRSVSAVVNGGRSG